VVVVLPSGLSLLGEAAARDPPIPLDDMANKLMRRLLPFNSPALSLVRAGD
jgi:hypothetical protein